MVGANLLPDALTAGLVEYVNIWGIVNILAFSMFIISINSIRSRFESVQFSRVYGLIMFIAAAVVSVLGNILLPLVCVI